MPKDKETIKNVPLDTTASFKRSFVAAVHPTTGNTTINKEKTKLTFTNFKSKSGPILEIYLVSNLDNVKTDFINLGNIKVLAEITPMIYLLGLILPNINM